MKSVEQRPEGQKLELYSHFRDADLYGAIAQLVEQRPEEPCVPGSSPGGATTLTVLGA